jgi:hypothetical protein
MCYLIRIANRFLIRFGLGIVPLEDDLSFAKAMASKSFRKDFYVVEAEIREKAIRDHARGCSV